MRFSAALLALAAAALLSQGSNPFAGRWDMTVTRGNLTFPSWMEVSQNGDVRVQLRTGNVYPVPAAKFDGNKLTVTAAIANEKRPGMTWELTLQNGKLTGTQTAGKNTFQISGVRAPELKRPAPKAWNNPEPLFNGKDLTGWQPINNTAADPNAPFTSHWTVENGELTNKAKGPNIRTTRTFDDFKFHIEYLCPPGENSGVYLRGRYEAQVAAAPQGAPPPPVINVPGQPYRNPYGGVGSIYGMLGPSQPPSFRPDWQIYDITLIGRFVTVVFNGVTLIDNKEIAGITGGALDSNEAEPGPIYFQGDHHGGIRYRNITIQTPRQ